MDGVIFSNAVLDQPWYAQNDVLERTRSVQSFDILLLYVQYNRGVNVWRYTERPTRCTNSGICTNYN